MTGAPGFRFEKKGRRYFLNGDPLPSVTTNLGDGFPAPGLMYWAATRTAATAVDQWDALSELGVSERFKLLERSPWASRDKAALRGTEIHALAERLVVGEEVDVPEEHLGPVQAYARFLDDWDVHPTLTEAPVLNVSHGWAGTIDLRARLRDGCDWLLDLKTGKGIYPNNVLQQAAYAHAEWFLDPSGTVRPWVPPERCGIVHVTPDSAELHPVDASEEAYLTYRYACMVARYVRKVDEARRERRAWPAGPAIRLPAAVR